MRSQGIPVGVVRTRSSKPPNSMSFVRSRQRWVERAGRARRSRPSGQSTGESCSNRAVVQPGHASGSVMTPESMHLEDLRRPNVCHSGSFGGDGAGAGFDRPGVSPHPRRRQVDRQERTAGLSIDRVKEPVRAAPASSRHEHRSVAQPATSHRTAAQGPPRPGARPKEIEEHHMLTRTYQSSVVGRSASIRRMRRRSLTSNSKLYCRTNGCPSFLELQPERGLAVCPICNYTLRIN